MIYDVLFDVLFKVFTLTLMTAVTMLFLLMIFMMGSIFYGAIRDELNGKPRKHE